MLERTAKGQFRLDGSDWDEISDEAKDLVRKMLAVDCRTRISTAEVLAHPWMHLDDEDEVVGDLKAPVTSPISKKSSLTGKRSTNLNNALRLLSGHVNELKTEKFAMSFTRLVSSLEPGAQNKGGGSMLSQFIVPFGKAVTIRNATPDTMAAERRTAEDEMMLFQNPEVKEALAATIGALGDDHGRLSMEQFMYILKRFAFSGLVIRQEEEEVTGGDTPSTPHTPASARGNIGTGLALMFLCRFVIVHCGISFHFKSIH